MTDPTPPTSTSGAADVPATVTVSPPAVPAPATPASQVKHPWRATVRTAFQGIVGAAAMAPLVYQQATHHDPAAATGYAALGLGIAGALTRVMAIPGVEAFLQKYVPFLATTPAQ